MIDGDKLTLEVDDHGSETLYGHPELGYQTFKDPVKLARALIDQSE